MVDFILSTIILIPSILLSLSVHEFAHAFSAYKLGDLTAKLEGRMSINPLKHIDPIGFLLLISPARFGWSKPVPINEYNFRKPILGTAIAAFAGPLSNIMLAILFAGIFRFLSSIWLIADGTILSELFVITIGINISLAIFNLLPIPPLDGFRILRAFLPDSIRYHWENLERYSGVFFILLFITPIGTYIFYGIGIILDFITNILI